LIDDFYIDFDGEKIIGTYNYKEDSLLKNKLTNYPKKELELKIKAYIQQYNNRLSDNKLFLD
jgi:hypothetical protein